MKLKFKVDWKVDKDKTEEKAKEVLFNCILKMHELANIYCPVDTGRLRSSIIFSPSTPGYKKYVLSDGVDYGIHVEFGTSPHVVSAEHLKSWARRVLKDPNLAYPVAKKIAMRGTEAHPFFRPALDQVKNVWIKRYWEKALK